MLMKLKTLFLSLSIFAQNICAKSFAMFNNFGGSQLADLSYSITESTTQFATGFGEIWRTGLELVNTFLYIVSSFIFLFIDVCQVIVFKVAGIQTEASLSMNFPIFRLILSETFLDIFISISGLAFLLFIIFSIVAIVISEYKLSQKDEKKDKYLEKNGSARFVGKKVATAAFMYILIPFILIGAFVFSSVFLSSINQTIRSDSQGEVSLGGQIWTASAYTANKYRMYAQNNQRIPILYDFQDPYADGTYVHYTTEQLYEIYNSWTTGKSLYDMSNSKEYPTFNQTLDYKNNNIVNTSSYKEFENWVSTPEQYYVMADFIDYAVQNNLEFDIKDTASLDIDWNRGNSDVKISSGVYNKNTNTLTINYVNYNKALTYANNYYSIEYVPNTLSAGSPVEDAVKVISQVMNISLDEAKSIVNQNKETYSSVSEIVNTSLKSYLDVENIITEIKDEKVFKILERDQSSTNVVRWKTEKAVHNSEFYTVYTLTKVYLNTITGLEERRGSVTVAQKEPNGAYYLVKYNEETENYEYTNQTIEYNYDGERYLDILEPKFVYVGWSEKLENDLNVIYADIDFENYVNYDKWADELGQYFDADANITNSNIDTMSTTLIHPLGLIMSELFLGVRFEDPMVTGTKFAFTTQYLEETIKQICLCVSGEINLSKIMYEVESFTNLYNAFFAPIMANLAEFEGFDLDNSGVYDVQSYVYRAYLASLLLSNDFSSYITGVANQILVINAVVSNMYKTALGTTVDIYGDEVKERVYDLDAQNNFIKLLSTGTVSYEGKYVYNSAGNQVLTCDANGLVSTDGIYIPRTNTKYIINEKGQYKILINGSYYSYSEYLQASIEDKPEWSNYFEQYFKVGIGYLTDSKEYIDLCNNQGIVTTNIGATTYYIPTLSSTNYVIVDGKYQVLYDGSFKSYTYFVENGKKDVWNSFFDTPESANLVMFVYESSIDDSSVKQNANVKLTLAKNILDEPINAEIKIADITKSSSDVSYATLYDKSSDYYLYQHTLVAKNDPICLTFDKLTADEQNAILDAVNYMENDVKENNLIRPIALDYLKAYVTDGSSEEMQLIMGAKNITYSEADDIAKTFDDDLKELESIKNEIKELERELQVSDKKSKREDLKKLLTQKTELSSRVYAYKKYLITQGLSSYLSTMVADGFCVIVNENKFLVEQSMSTTQITELVYGNRLNNTTLINALNSLTNFDKLTSYEQSAIIRLQNQLLTELNVLNSAITKIGEKKFLTDVELDIVTKLYYLKRLQDGIDSYKVFSNVNLQTIYYTNDEKYLELKNSLITYNIDIQTVFQRYIDGNTSLFKGTSLTTNDSAFELIKNYVKTQSKDLELLFVEDDFLGLYTENVGCFSYLKDFLKSFGNVCFGLEYKTNLNKLTVGAKDDVKIYDKDIVDSLVKEITLLLEDVNFGADISIPIVDANVLSGVSFEELPSAYKKYVSAIYDVFLNETNKFESTLENYKLAVTDIDRYLKGRYAMFNSSDLFKEYLTNYLEYFTYSANIYETQNDGDTITDLFIHKYVYNGYCQNVLNKYGSAMTNEEKLQYFHEYANAFSNIKFGTSGIYVSYLNDLQIKVVEDCLTYYDSELQKYTQSHQEEYNKNLNCVKVLEEYIGKKSDDNSFVVEAALNAGETTALAIFGDNIGYAQLIALLDFLGLDFDINKTSLKDYRISALTEISNFEEYAGESRASVQSRFLANLYLACADYQQNPADGKMVVVSDESTKQVILNLAGIKDQAEENLLNLVYQIAQDDVVSDEKYGSSYIVCTYNRDTGMYDPFIFASDSNKYGAPVSRYYSSMNGETMYYPIIAKGVLDSYGRPTAIREKNGAIEFYRDDVYIVDTTEVGLSAYYQTKESVAVDYNPISTLVNGITKRITGKNIGEILSEKFPILVSEEDRLYAYGVKESVSYHLDAGKCSLDYTFNPRTAITVNYLYSMADINSVILIFATVLISSVIVNAMYGVISNLLQLMIIIVAYPITLSTYALDGAERFKKWRKSFVKQFFMTYGFIVAINLYFFSLNVVQDVGQIITSVSDANRKILDQTIFGGLDLETIIGLLTTNICLLAVVTILKSMSDETSKNLFFSSDIIKSGATTKSQVDATISASEQVTSGYYFVDGARELAEDVAGILPSKIGQYISPEKREDRAIARRKRRNAKLADKYERKLNTRGLPQPVIDQAVKQYKDSLKEVVDAQEARFKAESKRRDARKKSAEDIISAYEEAKKQAKCPVCGYVEKKKAYKKAKGKTCPICQKGKLE